MEFVAKIPGVKPFGQWLDERYDLSSNTGISSESYHLILGNGFIKWVDEELTGKGPISLASHNNELFASFSGRVYGLETLEDGTKSFAEVKFVGVD